MLTNKLRLLIACTALLIGACTTTAQQIKVVVSQPVKGTFVASASSRDVTAVRFNEGATCSLFLVGSQKDGYALLVALYDLSRKDIAELKNHDDYRPKGYDEVKISLSGNNDLELEGMVKCIEKYGKDYDLLIPLDKVWDEHDGSQLTEQLMKTNLERLSRLNIDEIEINDLEIDFEHTARTASPIAEMAQALKAKLNK